MVEGGPCGPVVLGRYTSSECVRRSVSQALYLHMTACTVVADCMQLATKADLSRLEKLEAQVDGVLNECAQLRTQQVGELIF